jgi:AraC-like DNA-binding protein
MSARSLRRHLHDENTSFQIILDEFRADLATEYLVAGMMSAKEVAFLLGFAQVDAFRRAFKAWTGQTVGAFQSAARRAVVSHATDARHDRLDTEALTMGAVDAAREDHCVSMPSGRATAPGPRALDRRQ